MWAKLDDAILDNPKIIAAGPLGFALHVAAIVWCARNLTDGLIPKRKVASLLDLPSLQVSETNKVRVLHSLTADDVASDLVRLRLWHDRDDEYYEVHDFLQYNRSRQQVLDARDRTRQRVEKHRKQDGNVVTNAPVTLHPVPVPVPVPPDPEKKSSLRSPKAKGWKRVPETETLTDTRLAEGRRVSGMLGGDVKRAWEAFRDYEFYRPHHDVDATWRTWCRRTNRRQA